MEINTETAKLIQREKLLSYLDGICSGLEFANSCKYAIDRIEVIDELNRLGRNAFKDDTDYDNSFEFLDNLPLVLPMYQQGKWIKEYDNSALDGLYHCSACGRKLWIYREESVSDYPYCHCGSRNKEEVEE